MSGLMEREEAFEKKYAHDQELEFKLQMRACKALALWAASELQLSAPDTAAFVQDAIAADLHDGGLKAGRARIMQKLRDGKSAISDHGLDRQLEKLLLEARAHVMAG